MKKKHEEAYHVSNSAAHDHKEGAEHKHAQPQEQQASSQAENKHAHDNAKHGQEADKHMQEAEKRIKDLEKELAEAKDKHLRTVAEFDNYRKRIAKEAALTRSQIISDTAYPFLHVFDFFSKAMDASAKTADIASMRDGLKMILTEFKKAISELGIEQVNSEGQDFNPNLHEAIHKEHSDVHKEGKIIKQWSCGYRLGEKLLRPASVVVSMGPVPPPEANKNSEKTTTVSE